MGKRKIWSDFENGLSFSFQGFRREVFACFCEWWSGFLQGQMEKPDPSEEQSQPPMQGPGCSPWQPDTMKQSWRQHVRNHRLTPAQRFMLAETQTNNKHRRDVCSQQTTPNHRKNPTEALNQRGEHVSSVVSHLYAVFALMTQQTHKTDLTTVRQYTQSTTLWKIKYRTQVLCSHGAFTESKDNILGFNALFEQFVTQLNSCIDKV